MAARTPSSRFERAAESTTDIISASNVTIKYSTLPPASRNLERFRVSQLDNCGFCSTARLPVQ